MDGDSNGFDSDPASALISNLTTAFAGIRSGDHFLPVTCNDGGKTTNYLCCPSAAYLDYAIDELRHFQARPYLKAILQGLVECSRPLMAVSGLDRQVQPNNWLVATNLFPDLTQADIVRATKELSERYPDHAIIWRSVNDRSMADLKARFVAAGYRAFPSRQIYLFDARTRQPPRHRDERRDMKLLGRDDYVWTQGPWATPDYERMAWLYQKLYLDKYTWLNPVYTAAFVERSAASGFVDLHGLRTREGRLDGIIGFIDQGDAMAAPIVGYDTALPVDTGLYRRLMAMALKRARERRMLYNMSAGASAFKRNRGGEVTLEYMMVYNNHLPFPRRLAAGLIRCILIAVGVPLLRRFEL